jgi:transposase
MGLKNFELQNKKGQKQMEVLSKSIIEKWIVPYLSVGKRGAKPQVALSDVVSAILHRLKTGEQWRYLPLLQFFEAGTISWNGVYYYFNKWFKDGSFQNAWLAILRANKAHLDLSSLQLDGSHTPAKQGGEAVGYQGRKKANTTNALFFADRQGLPIAMAAPQAGNHHDVHEIRILFEQMCKLLEDAGISLKGVFMNADAGFDVEQLRAVCTDKEIEANIADNPRNSKESLREDYQYFDEQLYKERFVIERANAWLDSFKGLLIRYEKKIKSWMAQHWIAFSVLLLRKINSC